MVISDLPEAYKLWDKIGKDPVFFMAISNFFNLYRESGLNSKLLFNKVGEYSRVEMLDWICPKTTNMLSTDWRLDNIVANGHWAALKYIILKILEY